MSALPLPAPRETGLDACAASIVAHHDVVVLAGGEGARRLWTAIQPIAPAHPSLRTEYASDAAGAYALGAAMSGARVALLASGPIAVPRVVPALRELAALGRSITLVVPAHGAEGGASLPRDELGDAVRLLDAPVAVELAGEAARLGSVTSSISLRGNEIARPSALVFSLSRVGLARIDARRERPGDGALRVCGDASAPVAVIAAGEDLDGVISLARAAGVDALRGVVVDRMRPGLLPALREALRGVREATVIEAFPDALGEEGWLTLQTHRALEGRAEVRALVRGDEDLMALEDDETRDLVLMPLSLRRRLDLAGVHLSLAAWQRIELVARAALCAFPAELLADRDDFARAVRAAAEAVESPARVLARSDSPWNSPGALAELRARAGGELDAVTWAALHDSQRYALAHLASPRRDPARLGAALVALGLRR